MNYTLFIIFITTNFDIKKFKNREIFFYRYLSILDW